MGALIGGRETLSKLIATHGDRMAATRTSRLKRLVYMWVAAAVVLVVSIGESAAQPKKIIFLHSYSQNFEPGAAWSRKIRDELGRQSPWPLEIQE